MAALDRLRHFWFEATIAAGLTLTAVTAAYAAGAERDPRPRVETPVVAAAKAQAAPAEPEPAFAYLEPVPGHSVNSPFGLRRMPWETHGRLHEGVDIAAPIGRPVVAVADGVVTRAGTSASYGRYVEIKHAEGVVSFYAHMGRIDGAARPGVAVLAGRKVGAIGSSGTSTGPHLHFEIRHGDRPLNPVAFIGREFADAGDLPLQSAGRYSRRVRVAQVSNIPDSKRALMAKKDEASPTRLAKAERPRMMFEVAPRTASDAAVDASDTAAEIPTTPIAVPTAG